MLIDVLHTIISGSVHTLLLGDVGVARRVSHSQNIRLNRSLASLSLSPSFSAWLSIHTTHRQQSNSFGSSDNVPRRPSSFILAHIHSLTGWLILVINRRRKWIMVVGGRGLVEICSPSPTHSREHSFCYFNVQGKGKVITNCFVIASI